MEGHQEKIIDNIFTSRGIYEQRPTKDWKVFFEDPQGMWEERYFLPEDHRVLEVYCRFCAGKVRFILNPALVRSDSSCPDCSARIELRRVDTNPWEVFVEEIIGPVGDSDPLRPAPAP